MSSFTSFLERFGLREDDLARLRLTAKLDSNARISQYKLAFALLDHEELEEASAVLKKALSLDPNGWMADSAQGRFALHEGKLTQAVSFFEKSIATDPERGETHAWLGHALARLGRHREARDELRTSLRCEVGRELSEYCVGGIAAINEKIGTE